MKHIDSALSDYPGWVMLVFFQRYGGGFRAALAPSASQAQWFEDEMTSSGTGIPAMDLAGFLDGEGAWLPTAEAETPSAAIAALDRKLGEGPPQGADARLDWFSDVADAINDLMYLRHQSRDCDYWVQEAALKGTLPKAPTRPTP